MSESEIFLQKYCSCPINLHPVLPSYIVNTSIVCHVRYTPKRTWCYHGVHRLISILYIIDVYISGIYLCRIVAMDEVT